MISDRDFPDFTISCKANLADVRVILLFLMELANSERCSGVSYDCSRFSLVSTNPIKSVVIILAISFAFDSV